MCTKYTFYKKNLAPPQKFHKTLIYSTLQLNKPPCYPHLKKY